MPITPQVGLRFAQTPVNGRWRREWEILGFSHYEGWRIQVTSNTDRNSAWHPGRATWVSASWFDTESLSVLAAPSAPPPCGDGLMYAEVYGGASQVLNHGGDMPAGEMIAWIEDACQQVENLTTDDVIVAWWGYDPRIDESDVCVGIDGPPDLVACWADEALTWMEV